MTNDETVLECAELVRHFPVKGSDKVVQAVNDVSLTFGAGETVALVGESGSGKTTVGRMILGLLAPTSGRIVYQGTALDEMDRRQRRDFRAGVQAVFQDPYDSLDPRRPVLASVREPLRRLELEESARDGTRRAMAALEAVGLAGITPKTRPHDLSGSACQRVGIARALVTRPRFIVLDEPTSALSPIARAEVMRSLHDVQQSTGVSYLFITHDLAVVESLAHRVAVMYLGRVVEAAAAGDVFGRRLHPYTEALLGSVLFPDPDRLDGFGVLRGEIPSPIDLPPGCAFASRCAIAGDDCRTAVPPLIDDAVAGHHVACIRQLSRSRDRQLASTLRKETP
ncbi:oligopeptide/dipeptide ABC transporter ATP-binding protein [Jiangella muralis]|uniref:oligopeptide/dipeptide ABC transporter ATP-binding protein n=1 Tax=Jiangella muralis TaxID=702383 RepID=UPI00069D1C35|nr:ABC transporter ATP-binding protein [Jiangella muralis]